MERNERKQNCKVDVLSPSFPIWRLGTRWKGTRGNKIVKSGCFITLVRNLEIGNEMERNERKQNCKVDVLSP